MTQPKKLFDFEKVQVGDELGSFEYVLTQEHFDKYRRGVADPEATFPTLGFKHVARVFSHVYDFPLGGVNAGQEAHFFNPPVPGKKIKVTGRFADKYIRRGNPYVVTEATAVDEDGRLIEKMRGYILVRPKKAGEKWAGEKWAQQQWPSR